MISFKKYVEVKGHSLENVDLDRDLHFDNIFGSKLRVAFPLDQNEYIQKLTNELEKLEYKVDYDDLINKKIAYKRMNTKQGEKLRPQKIGKILQANKSKELLDWWQKNSESLKKSETGASVVVSRSPIDLIRMSDHDGISSCHSPDNSYFQCARQEAKTGGAIAYVVKNSDLAKVNLQDNEIFRDRDRGVQGIVPLERVRLRRLSNKDADLIMPELRTYGIRNIGFLDAVKKWAKSSQSDIIKQINPKEDFDSFDLKGGTYQDSQADDVWNDFFDTASARGRKESDDFDEENEDSNMPSLERAQDQLEEHQREWKHVSAYVDGDDGYLYYSGYVGVEIPKKMLIVDFDEHENNIETVIRDEIDIDGIEAIESEEQSGNYLFRIDFNDRNDHYGNEDLNLQFERFLDYCDDVDRDYKENLSKVYKVLMEDGYLKNPTEKITFKNFDINLDDDGLMEIKSKEPEKIGYLKDFEIRRDLVDSRGGKARFNFLGQTGQTLGLSFTDFVNQARVLPFKLDSSISNRLFMKEAETQGWLPSRRANYDDKSRQSTAYDKQLTTKLTGWVYLDIEQLIPIKDRKVLSAYKNLDRNWDFYLKKLNKLFDGWIGIVNKKINLKQLAKKPTFPKRPKQLSFGFKEWMEATQQSLKGYKIVAHDSGKLYSLQNPNLEYSVKVGTVESPNEGLFLGTDKDFVMNYYSELTDKEDALLTYEYDVEDVLSGNPDEQGEVKVKKAKLKSVQVI